MVKTEQIVKSVRGLDDKTNDKGSAGGVAFSCFGDSNGKVRMRLLEHEAEAKE